MSDLNISPQYEEQYISDTLDIVNANYKNCDEDVRKMKTAIDDMWDQYFAGDVEIWTPLHNTMAMYEEQSKALARYSRARKKPYFGRIIFTDDAVGTKESLYIGRCGINKDITTQVVADWRAPISNVYYENGLGKCTILSPDGDDINLDLELKRTFDIEDGKLLGFVDSDVVANDELLTKYLARNKQAVLGEIVATIQKEQNDIIRRTPFRNVLVQGAAGSGKTTVAMHRISYILYNYGDRITPSNFFIIGSNRMLLNYITGVLPELDVEGVRQMTMEEMFVHILGDSWDEDRYSIAYAGQEGTSEEYFDKGRTERFEQLKEFCGKLERECILTDDIVLNRDCFVEGLEKGKSGIWDRSGARGTSDYLEFSGGTCNYEKYDACIRLLPGSFAQRLIDENPDVSVQCKIMLLNDKLKDNLEFEFTSHESRYTVREKAAVTKAFSMYFGKTEFGRDAFDIYDEFLQSIGAAAKSDTATRYDVYDLAALAYIYRRVIDCESVNMLNHIVIDEAQDYGMMAYRALDYCFPECTYTVMGDVSQNIRFDSGINNWDELRGLLLRHDGDSFCTLRKSYRNTVEISEFATKILDHGDFEVYPVEPIIRHGDCPKILEIDVNDKNAELREKEAATKTVKVCNSWNAAGHGTIAIVCRTVDEANKVHELLSAEGLELMDNDPERSEFGNGIMVLPVTLTKGLEFDAVLIWNPTRESYPTDDRHAKLLYVAATRALHELCIVSISNLTGLIADEVAADKVRHVVDADPVCETDTRTAGEKLRDERRQKAEDDSYVKSKLLAEATRKTQLTLNAEQVIKQEKVVLNAAIQETENLPPAKGSDDSIFATKAPETFYIPAGHASPSLMAKWIMKQNNGIFVQSRFGVLRLYPISASVIRISFCRGSELKLENENLTRQFAMLKKCVVRENTKAIELSPGRMTLSLDKQTGVITYKDEKGRELLKEKATEPRVIVGDGTKAMGFTFFVPAKSRTWHALNTHDGSLKYIGDNALYISHDDGSLPLAVVRDSFAILPVNPGRTAINNLSGYGTALVTEGDSIDYYFMVGSEAETREYYQKLTCI